MLIEKCTQLKQSSTCINDLCCSTIHPWVGTFLWGHLIKLVRWIEMRRCVPPLRVAFYNPAWTSAYWFLSGLAVQCT
ncbi:hypothetical protein RP20_CCG021526 [Aedes albopictus]|nr:hypothetical protein RP20_CCG021526 [Aedes albopictus]